MNNQSATNDRSYQAYYGPGSSVESTMAAAAATSSGAHRQQSSDDLKTVEGELSEPNPAGDGRVK